MANGKRKGGCLFYGCLILVVVMILGLLAAYFGARYAYNKAVTAYTSTEPMKLSDVTLSEGELTALQERVEGFSQSLEAGEEAEPLRLTAEELNALIVSKEEFGEVADKVRVSIEGDRIHGTMSLPLETMFPDMESLKGRYLNATSAFQVGLDNGQLVVRLESVQVGGKDLPAELVRALKEENLAAEMGRESPELNELMKRLKEIRVEDGELVVVPKPASEREPLPEAPEEAQPVEEPVEEPVGQEI